MRLKILYHDARRSPCVIRWTMRDGAFWQAQECAMDREATRESVRATMESDFLPEPSPDTLSQVDRRMAHAAEYVAYRLGQIDNKLGRLVALLEAFVGEGKPSPAPARDSRSSTPG
jgi:hypothetical protein